jgi:hypothetical protein
MVHIKLVYEAGSEHPPSTFDMPTTSEYGNQLKELHPCTVGDFFICSDTVIVNAQNSVNQCHCYNSWCAGPGSHRSCGNGAKMVTITLPLISLANHE